MNLGIDKGNLEPYMKERVHIVNTILSALNKENHSCVLKGGTALFLYHGLDRYSDNLEIDSFSSVDLLPILGEVSWKSGRRFIVSLEKDTNLFKGYTVDYQGTHDGNPYALQLDISLRYKERIKTSPAPHSIIDGVAVYDLKTLMYQKMAALQNRDKGRDFYDVAWIVKSRPDLVDPGIADGLLTSISYKGIDVFLDLMIEEFRDDRILRDVDPLVVAQELMDSLERLRDFDGEIKNETVKLT